MSSSPFFSIITPVYNVAPYIAKCLDSVLGQTFGDLEIICVNDGSTDSSRQILDEYAKKDSRVIVIHKKNAGPSSARNTGLNAAKGKYICFLDSDDFWALRTCQRLYEVIQENDPDIIAFGAHIFPLEPEPIDWYRYALSPRTVFFDAFDPKILISEPGARPFIWLNCYRRPLLEEHSLRFDEGLHLGEDQVFQFMVYPRASRFAFIKDKLYYYRWTRENSLMHTYKQDPKRRFSQHIQIVSRIFDHWKETGDMDCMADAFLDWSLGFLGEDFRALDTASKKEFSKLANNIWSGYNFRPFQRKLSGGRKNLMDAILAPSSARARIRLLLLRNVRRIPGFFHSVRQKGFRYALNKTFGG